MKEELKYSAHFWQRLLVVILYSYFSCYHSYVIHLLPQNFIVLRHWRLVDSSALEVGILYPFFSARP